MALIEAVLRGSKVGVDGDGKNIDVVVLNAACEDKPSIQQRRLAMDAVQSEVASEKLLR